MQFLFMALFFLTGIFLFITVYNAIKEGCISAFGAWTRMDHPFLFWIMVVIFTIGGYLMLSLAFSLCIHKFVAGKEGGHKAKMAIEEVK